MQEHYTEVYFSKDILTSFTILITINFAHLHYCLYYFIFDDLRHAFHGVFLMFVTGGYYELCKRSNVVRLLTSVALIQNILYSFVQLKQNYFKYVFSYVICCKITFLLHYNLVMSVNKCKFILKLFESSDNN